MKFKIGDKVIPIEYSETAGFSYEKKICIGIPGKIEVINGNQYGVHGFYWPESALMLVEEKPRCKYEEHINEYFGREMFKGVSNNINADMIPDILMAWDQKKEKDKAKSDEVHPEPIPFNLERALNGDQVVTRDGRKVGQLHLFQTDNDTHPLHGVVTGISAKWTRDGKWIGGDYIEDNDLFMVPQKKGYWVNLFRLSDGSIRIGDMVYSSESEAKDNPATAKSNYIKTVKIHEDHE